MVFVHGVQSLHGLMEKASFVLDVNSGVKYPIKAMQSNTFIMRGGEWQLHYVGL